MTGPNAVLEMRAASKSFPTPHGRVEVLNEVSLSVSQGDFLVITGPSGSGKSTLLHLAGLLDYPTCGKVLLEGQDVLELDDADLCQLRKQKIGMVFQNYYLLPHRSVLENVLFRFRYLDHDRCDAERRALQALEAMDLAGIAQRPARLLSGGEMQRVAIARALALEPRLLLADEPTGNLDSASAHVVMNCFRKLNEVGMTIVMVTHNEALLDFATRHLVCRAGSIRNGLS